MSKITITARHLVGDENSLRTLRERASSIQESEDLGNFLEKEDADLCLGVSYSTKHSQDLLPTFKKIAETDVADIYREIVLDERSVDQLSKYFDKNLVLHVQDIIRGALN
jgi:hypothetical protein